MIMTKAELNIAIDQAKLIRMCLFLEGDQDGSIFGDPDFIPVSKAAVKRLLNEKKQDCLFRAIMIHECLILG